ncbi:SDR family NAD(P)-dependent oxidoreductase [Aeromicrobium panaciterrae]|uniref:oxidoreductase n=1 Tax=Aeromicrobium panaciterrae TaxID=363861 RepID=UPI0031D39A16
MSWKTTDIPDLTGKRAVVTGVTGGLGLHTAIELARHGAYLAVTARNPQKAEEAVARIQGDVPGATVDVVALDLADLADVKRAADEIAAYGKVDILVNNAGIMFPPKPSTTVDGYELQMGTNHLGHFALTAHLWPLLVTSHARIVSVSSNMHKATSGIDLRTFTTPEGSPRRYKRTQAYAESKVANLLFANELDRRVKAAGIDVVSVSAHPGYASTNITKTGPSVGGNSLQATGMHQVSKVIAQSAAAGAWPLLMAATDPSLKGGEYVGPGGPGQWRGRPKLVGMSRTARDTHLANALWAASESAAGVEFTV